MADNQDKRVKRDGLREQAGRSGGAARTGQRSPGGQQGQQQRTGGTSRDGRQTKAPGGGTGKRKRTPEEIRRRRRAAARRKRERQIRIRMILVAAVLVAGMCVAFAAVRIHMRNVKEEEAALASSRRTEEEQAAAREAQEAPEEENAAAVTTAEDTKAEEASAAAAATTGKKSEDTKAEDASAAVTATTGKKAEDTKAKDAAAAAAATIGKKAEDTKAEDDAAAEASRRKAEEDGALAASRKAAQEQKEKKEAEKIPGLNESYDFKKTDATTDVPEDIESEYAVIVDLKSGAVVAGRDYDIPINPASMTKVLTLLVAVENTDLTRLDTDTYEINQGITDYVFTNQMSQVGFDIGDTPSIRSLLYGTILPSGADAALALAEYTAGSEEAFVELMNKKLEELGISDTAHFTNVVGAFADDHYCSLLDMATIMRAAIDNELCREVLDCRYYEVARSQEDDAEVIGISNWFLRRIEDKDTHGTVRGGKTGFTDEAGNCAVSYQESDNGGHYICVTANAPGIWPCIYDHVELYEVYTE